MNVLIITNWYPTRRNPVAGVFVKEFAEALSNFCNVTVFHPESSKNVRLFKIEEINDGNFKVIKLMYRKIIPNILSYLYISMLSIVWLLRNYNKISPDIIHAHNHLAAVWAIIVGNVKRTPVIITEHGLHKEGDYYKNSVVDILDRILRYIIIKVTFNIADMLIFVSRASRDYIIERYKIANIYRIVPNVLNQRFMDSKIHKISPRIYRKKKKILFIGGLYPRKGLEYLLEAVRLISQERTDFMVEIIGDGPFRQHYEWLVERYGLKNFISFLGRVSDDKKVKALMTCDFLVLPSLFENFGIVLIEAMACGKPVITTSSGGQVEFVTEENGILVRSKDFKALAEAIKFMLNNLDKYSPRDISYYVKKRFNKIVVGRSLRNTYNYILSEES